MTSSKHKVGGEIDAYCTKCRLDLNHRIVAMVGDQAKRVECSTCASHHNYYRPKNAPAVAPVKAAKAAKTATGRPSSAPRAPSGASARAMAAAQAENARERNWEKAVSGKAVTAFKAYRVTGSFNEDDLVHHAKFGDGFVMRVLDKSKIEVMFRDGARTLAQGIEGA